MSRASHLHVERMLTVENFTGMLCVLAFLDFKAIPIAVVDENVSRMMTAQLLWPVPVTNVSTLVLELAVLGLNALSTTIFQFAPAHKDILVTHSFHVYLHLLHVSLNV